MAKIYVERPDDSANFGKDYKIYVDDKEIETIGSGQSKHFEVQEGEHIIDIKMSLYKNLGWCGSERIPISIGKDDIERLKITGFRYGLLRDSLFIIPWLTNIVGKHNFEIVYRQYLYLLYLPYVIMVLYYFTIGKRKYLTLKLEE